MKLSGFFIIRNGVKFDYPFLESLRSVLPLVDEMIVNVGIGEDATLEKIKALASQESKIRFFESDWQLDNPEKKKSGLILSEQTNLALDRCSNDWCFYIQADEVFHEDDRGKLKNALTVARNSPQTEGLLFDYVHFYGSYDVVQNSRSVYRREVRLIRKSAGGRSVGDAQSFRKQDGSKLHVVHSGARIFHYGWVRPPEAMREKTFFMDQLYHGDPSTEDAKTRRPHTGDNYKYKRIPGLFRFKSTHPEVMRERIRSKNWNWDFENSPKTWRWRDLKKFVLDGIERATGIRLFEYRSYRLIRK